VVTDVNGCSNTGAFTIMMTATGAPVAADGFILCLLNTPVTGNLNSLVRWRSAVPIYQVGRCRRHVVIERINRPIYLLAGYNFIGTASSNL